ncbi:MAG: Flp pilus assembly protein CpaB [Chloroflexi bacterium]|nr:Flp pilus assembly protein CpaB [Chloroflexota bacterium]
MAQSIAGVAAGGVNRRFLFLALILATLSAMLAYVALSRSDSGGGGAASTSVPVVVANLAIPAGTLITSDMLELRNVPSNAVSDQALSTTTAAIGQVARFPIALNEQVLLTKIVGGGETASNDVLSHQLKEGLRGMAIQISPVAGAGGLVLPGDYVDVYLVPDQLKGDDHERAFLVAANVEVTAVEQVLIELPPSAPGLEQEGTEDTTATTGDGGQRVRGAEAASNPEAITVTLMLTSEQAANLFCGDVVGELRLAVRAFGDPGSTGLPVETCTIYAE